MSPSDESRRPITVVSGLPRSGTSLMMQILAAAGMPLLYDELRAPDPSNPRGYFELEAVKRTRSDTSWLDRAPGHAVKVIHALLAHLPRDRRYQVIWMERPLAEVIASQNAMLARGGLDEGGLSSPQLERVFRAQITRAHELLDGCACFRWTRVSTPDLVREPLPVLADLCRFLGIDPPLRELSACIRPELYHDG